MANNPHSWHAKLAHGLSNLAARNIRARCDGPVPDELLTEPEELRVATPAGIIHTLAWGLASDSEAGPGAAPPVVLVHGLNANARYWAGAACCLAAGHHGPARRVLALDMRGHGATGQLPGGYELTVTRADLEAWLDALSLDRVYLAGHSWGGKVVLDFAAGHPGRVARLALVDPVPPMGLHGLILAGRKLRDSIFAPERGPFESAGELTRSHGMLSWLRHADGWMHDAFDASFRLGPDDCLHHVLSNEDFTEIYDRVLSRPSPLPLDAVTMPVLLARASMSVIMKGQTKTLQKQLPHMQTVQIPGEHSLHAANPVALARSLAEFFE